MITDIRSLINRLDAIEEGAIGAAIGGGLGSLVGQRDAGAKMGSDLGDFVSNLFNKSDRTHTQDAPVNKDSNSPTGYVHASTGDAVKPPQKGFMTTVKQALGSDVDNLGVPKNGYKKYPQMIFDVNTSLKTGGEYADIIIKTEAQRGKNCGWPVIVRSTYDYKGATLALIERDQWMQGFWDDMANTPGFGDNAKLFAPFGWKLIAHSDGITSNKFGNANAHAEKYNTDEGVMVAFETTQIVPFTSPTGQPSMHLLGVEFVGPEDTWNEGARRAIKDLINSIDLKGVKQLKG